MTGGLDPQFRHSLDRLVGYAALDAQPNWGDVAERSRRARRRSLSLALVAGLALAVFVSAAFAFGNDLWGLVAGKPVSTSRLSAEEQRMFASLASGKPVLRTQPNSPALRRLGQHVSVRLLANRSGYTFYVIRVKGRYPTRCFATGHVGRPELFGSMVCPLAGGASRLNTFPSAKNPVLDQSSWELRRGDPSPHAFRLAGFAAVAVKKVGFLTKDGGVVATVPVVNSTYLRATGLPDTGVTAIVGFDGTGRRVYCQDIAAADPCHTNEQRQATAPRPHPSPPSEPRRARLGALLQRGESQGVTVAIYKPGVAIFDLSSASARLKRVASSRTGAGCLRARFMNGRWLTDDLGASGQAVGASPERLRVDLVQGGAPGVQNSVPPPYDGCEINGGNGHRWNDAFGTRAPVEIPLTAVGRHFFNDRAAARDLAYFVRSGRVQKIRLSSNPTAGLDGFVHRYPSRVVELTGPGGSVPRDVIGFWIGAKTITFTTTSSTGRRLFVVAERGTYRLPSTNLGDLALVF